ncbi:MAG TPA: DUF2855 family protein [Acidimicrobiales bacterium]|nr:DUF2855 family protein [Acidimicrobiales bacterium]
MDLLVKRDALHETRLTDEPPPALADGEARLRIDAFALTANNITYAVFGEAMGYWNFFHAPEGWGRIPVWGFADVVESAVPGLVEGDRFYGYVPMSEELVVTPIDVGERGFTDGAAHRSAMAATYNQYARTSADPDLGPAHEDAQMLLRPLFLTGFLIDDHLADNDRFGASSVILTSASSKTAAGAAFFLAEREGLEVVGLTSPAHRAFVEGLGVYDRVLGYDEVDGLPGGRAVLVDVAGSADARAAVHRHYGDDLARSVLVGGTHWDEQASPDARGPLPGPAPAMFFAPDQITKRTAEWGPGGFAERVRAAWSRAVAWSDGWLQVEHGRGPEAVQATYREVLAGRTAPSSGHVLSMAR